MEENKPTYILSDLPTDEDALDFTPYVETLADIIRSPETSTPLTIGVFAPGDRQDILDANGPTKAIG